jgi:uncharacterized protein (DUF983 family)
MHSFAPMSRKARTALGAIVRNKCPQCREGNIFPEPNSYKFKQTTVIHPNCPVCGEDFQREPGFYFGAAYVSYALTVALWVSVLVALYTFDALGWITFGFFSHVTLFLGTGVTLLVLLLPPLYRLSRSIWLHMMTRRNDGLTPDE